MIFPLLCKSFLCALAPSQAFPFKAFQIITKINMAINIHLVSISLSLPEDFCICCWEICVLRPWWQLEIQFLHHELFMDRFCFNYWFPCLPEYPFPRFIFPWFWKWSECDRLFSLNVLFVTLSTGFIKCSFVRVVF